MNYETSISGYEETDVAIAGVEGRKRSRKAMLLGVLVAALAIGGGIYGYKQWSAPKTAATAKPAATPATAKQLQKVSFVQPGVSIVENKVLANGTLAARRDMPIGAAGEGGLVTQVLVEQGQWVKAGQVLAIVDRQVQVQQTSQIAAQIRVAESDARLAQNELDRARALAARGFVSKADIDRKTAQRDGAQARLAVARAQLGENSARLRRLDIRAPANGLILDRNIEPGQVIGPGSGGLFRLAMNGEMEMHAKLAEGDLVKLANGAGAEVTPVGTSLVFRGRIWQIEPTVDATLRQGTARIALGYNSALRPGGFASAKIDFGSIRAPVLDESAVQSDPDGTNYVYVIGPDNKIQRINVETGSVTPDRKISILKGLTGTERIVQSAGGFLQVGEEVIPHDASAPVAAAK